MRIEALIKLKEKNWKKAAITESNANRDLQFLLSLPIGVAPIAAMRCASLSTFRAAFAIIVPDLECGSRDQVH